METRVAEQRMRFVRERYIREWSTYAYKMEYRGFLANHLLHAVVALAELGASEELIEGFVDRYVSHLCVGDKCAGNAASTMTWPEARALIGKREDFEELRAMYEEEVQRLTPDGAVARYLPTLVEGLAGSLLHAIIQLGYAYRVGGDLPLAEGLAFLHYSSLSFGADDDDQPPASGSTPFTRAAAFRLAASIQDDEVLVGELSAHMRTEAILNIKQGSLQPQILCFSNDKERGNPVLFDAVKTMVNQFDFRAINGAVAVDFALWLYNLVDTNDFVLLHATTSAWALNQVEHLLAAGDRAPGACGSALR